MTDYPIRIPGKSIDDSRIHFDETTVILDALKHSSNRFGVAPSDMPSPEATALLAVIRPFDPVDDDTLVDRAAQVAQKLDMAVGEGAIRDYLQWQRSAQANGEGDKADHVVATCAARIRQVAAIRKAERREADAWVDAQTDTNMQTRQALAEAILATQAAHMAAPTRRRTLADIVEANRRRRLESQGRDAIGIVTPTYPMLSDAFCGWRGLILLAAMPGIGKTTLATAAAFDAVKGNADTCAVLVSFEMPTDTLVDRTTAQMAGIGQRTLRLGDRSVKVKSEGMLLSAAHLDSLRIAEDRLSKLSDRFDMVGKEDIGEMRGDGIRGCMAQVAQRVEQLKQSSGAKRAFVVIDHFGAVPVSPPDGMTWPSDTERARYLLSGLVTLRDALGGDDPVVVICQVRKSDNKEPDLASIIGTADSGYAADAVVTFRYAEAQGKQERKPTDPVEVVAEIAKGRDMMLRTEIPFTLDPTTSRIREGNA